MRNRAKISILVVLALLVVSVAAAAQPVTGNDACRPCGEPCDPPCPPPCDPCPPPPCAEGCTPGFWKQEQHFYAWPTALCVADDGDWKFPMPDWKCDTWLDLGFEPWNFLVQGVYAIPECLLTDGDLDLNGDGEPDSLLDALNYEGGQGVDGKVRNLLRAAVASLLNGATMGHQPPYANIRKVNNALALACDTGNTCLLEYWYGDFDDKNNQYCVFSPDAVCVPPCGPPCEPPCGPTCRPPCPPPPCGEGCTPGFWKQEQHFYAWEGSGYSPDTLLGDVFELDCLEGRFGSDTLLEALGYKGGKGFRGKARILLRAAVASLLNGATMDHRPPSETVGLVNDAIALACDTGNKCLLKYWYREFDARNNQYCVFSPDGCAPCDAPCEPPPCG
ncbi:MAG: hypothetical protein GTO49_07575 [Anaerolineae bacterium]|nr:hypothetical protein [Anaerolineae bacterium]